MDNKVATTEESIAQSIVPYNRDDDRARYLGLRASGFSLREALRWLGKAKSTLSLWRKDPEFLALENRIPELRATLALEYANLEFLRNYRLILEKDYRVIKGSLEEDKILSTQDHQYLLKLRSHYTPQQLQIIEILIADKVPGREFDFTDIILNMARTQESITIGTRHRSASELATIAEKE